MIVLPIPIPGRLSTPGGPFHLNSMDWMLASQLVVQVNEDQESPRWVSP